jgi:hypothetical protein
MALQTSGPISIIDLFDEFSPSGLGSLSPPHSLSEFYDVADGIPASGTIDLADFYGASAVPPDPVITEGSRSYTTVGKISITYYMRGYALNVNEVDGSFGTGTIGSISPSTYNGVTIEAAALVDENFEYRFTLILQGNRAKGFFTSVTPQGGNTLTSASSTHSYNSSGNYTKWAWNDLVGQTTVLGPNISAQWNGSGTSTITFV